MTDRANSGGAVPASRADNVVLVHGAYADGSSWSGVIALLQQAGMSVTAVQNPLTSLDDDAAATIRALDLQSGPTVLVGPSWAGTVISQNSIHDLEKAPYAHIPEHYQYIYFDEGSSYIQVRDNWTPEERFFENAVGPGNIWTNNGPKVDAAIVARAGLPPEMRDALGGTDPAVVLQSAGRPE